jgi:hypothetical protein
MKLQIEKLREYLSKLYNGEVTIEYVGELGKTKEKMLESELKGFGYGTPYLVEFKANNKQYNVVLSTMRTGEGFGHEHFSDRAKCLIWQNYAFNKLPKHVRSIDVGAFTKDNDLISVGKADEFFILVDKIEGTEYHKDLDRIASSGKTTELDLNRAKALSDYLVKIHTVKKNAPNLYVRRIRELLGDGEQIMGLIDSYPTSLDFTNQAELMQIEKGCLEWRWKLKSETHRLSQTHGDYHPWNILFHEDTDFTVLDRSREEWGEPADDVAAMSINYIFYSLINFGELMGPFEQLYNMFINNYLDKTHDQELLSAIQPFYVWRALVVASPIWYPTLEKDVRRKLFNFIHNMIDIELFNPKEINIYIKR